MRSQHFRCCRYLETLGHALPPQTNPADFSIDVVSDKANSDVFLAWKNRSARHVRSDVQVTSLPPQYKRIDFYSLVVLISWRSLVQQYRRMEAALINNALVVASAVLLAVLYFNVRLLSVCSRSGVFVGCLMKFVLLFSCRTLHLDHLSQFSCFRVACPKSHKSLSSVYSWPLTKSDHEVLCAYLRWD